MVSDVELVIGQIVHEGLNQEVSGEVEDETEGDGDGQRGQRLPEDGQEQQGEAQTLEGGAEGLGHKRGAKEVDNESHDQLKVLTLHTIFSLQLILS